MADNKPLKISQLPPSFGSGINDSDIIAASRVTGTAKLETQKVSIGELRKLMDYGNAFNSINEAIDGSVDGQQFYVFVDDTKEFVYRYMNMRGIASPVMDMNGVQIREATTTLIKRLATVGSQDGFGLIGTVTSFEALRLLKPRKEGWRVNLAGYYEGTSKGSGVFVAKQGNAPDDNGFIAKSATPGLYWERQDSGSLNPFMFGAKGDGTTVDTKSFIDTVAAGVRMNFRRVSISGGFSYRINDEVNVGGVDYYGNMGCPIIGDGVDSTTILFESKDKDTPCFSMRGGSGTNTPKKISGLTILPYDSKRWGYGTGILMEGTCMGSVDDVNIRFLNNGVLFHNRLKGSFTEYNTLSRMRIDRNINNIYILTTEGDNSFHGLRFRDIQNQIIENGYGLKILSTNGSYAHIYNADLTLHFFGVDTGSCCAISMTKTNLDNSECTFFLEGNAKAQSTDESWFHAKGNFNVYNGRLTYDCPVPPRLSVTSSFIFNNTSSISSLGDFKDPTMVGYYPQVFDLNWADRALIGAYPGIVRVRATNATANSLVFINGEVDNAGFRFGSVADGGRVQDFLTKWSLNTQGTVQQAHNQFGTMYLNSRNTVTSEISRVFFSLNTFSPGSTNQYSLGNSAQMWTQVFSVNGTINVSDKRFKTDPRHATKEELLAFYEIGKTLPWVWQWKDKVYGEGDIPRDHSGPTVQDAIGIMGKHGLDWRNYSCFCYDEWDDSPEKLNHLGEVEIPGVVGGNRYSFRKDELLLWIVKATIAKQSEIEERLLKLESKK